MGQDWLGLRDARGMRSRAGLLGVDIVSYDISKSKKKRRE
jgi:hypothetical protein